MENTPNPVKYEKDEKDEKEVEKHEEKSVDEKWRRDPLGTIAWAAILIWAGVVVLADNLGYLPALPMTQWVPAGMGRMVITDIWTYIFLGAGVIVLVEVVFRLLAPAHRRPIGARLIFAIILLAVGLSSYVSWKALWPIILIGVGLSILIRGILRKR